MSANTARQYVQRVIRLYRWHIQGCRHKEMKEAVPTNLDIILRTAICLSDDDTVRNKKAFIRALARLPMPEEQGLDISDIDMKTIKEREKLLEKWLDQEASENHE